MPRWPMILWESTATLKSGGVHRFVKDRSSITSSSRPQVLPFKSRRATKEVGLAERPSRDCVRLRPWGCYTREETHMEPENGPLEDYFPLQPSGFQVLC